MFRELKGVPQPPKKNRSGAFRKQRLKNQGPKFDKRKAGMVGAGPQYGPRYRRGKAGVGTKFGPVYKRERAGLGPRGPKFGPVYRSSRAGLGPRGQRFGPRFSRRLAGVGHRQPRPPRNPEGAGGARASRSGGSAYRAYRRSRGRGGPSLVDRLIRRLMNKVLPRKLTMAEMFRRNRTGDGRNHGYTGVKKPGKTGLAGR